MNEINELRSKIDEIDKAIIELLEKRMRLVDQISKIKKQRGMPIYDGEREREVVETRVKMAAERGLSEELAREVFSAILHHSKRVQASRLESTVIAIYGYGGMARVLAKLFSKAGYEVIIDGRDKEKADRIAKELGVKREDISNGTWVIIATPPEGVREFIKNEAPRLKEGVILSDILSVKSIVKDLPIPSHVKYISLHPLFGPNVEPYGETVIAIPVKCEEKDLEKVEKILGGLGLKVVRSGLEEHDRGTAVTQVLHHFAMIVLKKTMEEVGDALNVDYEKFITRSLRRTLETVWRIEELKPVILEIQKMNPYAPLVRNKFIEVGRRVHQELSRS